jgi:hypothetical protein
MVSIPDIRDPKQQSQITLQESLCPIISAAMRFFGAVMILSSVGIWLVPVISGDGAMVLMKLLVSVFFACVGSVLIETGKNGATDEIHMCPETRMLRHVKRKCNGVAATRAQFDFDQISDIRLQDGMLKVLGDAGATLLSLPVERVENLGAIREMLGRNLAKTS